MKPAKNLISILVPVKNEAKLLENFLESIRQLNYPSQNLEIIIAEGQSTDNTKQVAKKLGAKVVDNPKQTVGPGRNAAFKVAKGDLIAFSDADCEVDPNWLSNSLKYFSEPKVAGVGGPNFTPKEEGLFAQAVGFFMSQPAFSAGSIHGLNLPYIKEVKSLPGCNAIYRKEILDQVMPIDESLLACEDTEMNWKIINLGYKLLSVPDVFVWHHQRSTPKKFFKKIYRWAIGRVQLGRKNSQMLNIIHIGAGFSLPLLVLIIILLFLINPLSLLYLFFSICLLFSVFCLLALIKTRSPRVALYFPLVILIALTAWSAGFIKELIFPLNYQNR